MFGLRLLYRFENGINVYFTNKDEGDARSLVSKGIAEAELTDKLGRQIRLVTAHQVHSEIVNIVDSRWAMAPDADLPDGDALVTRDDKLGLGILVADCAPVALVSDEGVFAAVHAGWQGVYKGILPQTVKVMRSLGATEISAYVAPSIKSECYEFRGEELQQMSQILGPSVVGQTSWATVSLDLLESIKQSLKTEAVTRIDASQDCTACGGDYFSYRARQSPERHLMVIVGGGGRR